MRRCSTCFVTLAMFLAVALCCNSVASAATDPEKWEERISQFEARDRAAPPPKEAILFLGSSSIVGWDLEKSFPQRQTLNRGFGGSEIGDSIHFFDRVVLPYEPRVIVFYAGDNDIAHGKSADDTAKDFARFAELVDEYLPQTKIVFVAIKPSVKRWSMWPEMKHANDLIEAQCRSDEDLYFCDIAPTILDETGHPRRSCFVEDGLHLTPETYRLWSAQVEEILTAIDQQQSAASAERAQATP